MGSARPSDDRRAPADEFAVRYYRWALDDARREVRENFPLLRTVKSGLVIRAVAYFESLADDERLRAAAALVKRSHRRAVELTGDSGGAGDDAIDRDYRSAARIARPEEESRPLREGVSLCGWLGIGDGHTTWNRLTQADTAEAARSLARVGAHFVQAVPALVAGLAPD